MTNSPTTTPAATTDEDDALGVSDLIRESFNLINGDTVSVEEEGHSLEALTESYQTYVQEYFATIAATEQRAVQAMEQSVKAWSQETAEYQAELQARAEAAQTAQAVQTAKGTGASKAKGA